MEKEGEDIESEGIILSLRKRKSRLCKSRTFFYKKSRHGHKIEEELINRGMQ